MNAFLTSASPESTTSPQARFIRSDTIACTDLCQAALRSNLSGVKSPCCCHLQQVIERERKGDYLGKTVQVVPHITDAIQDWIEEVAKVPVDGKEGCPDVCVIELGGTVGDIESSPFVEALRQAVCLSCDQHVRTGNCFCI